VGATEAVRRRAAPDGAGCASTSSGWRLSTDECLRGPDRASSRVALYSPGAAQRPRKAGRDRWPAEERLTLIRPGLSRDRTESLWCWRILRRTRISRSAVSPFSGGELPAWCWWTQVARRLPEGRLGSSEGVGGAREGAFRARARPEGGPSEPATTTGPGRVRGLARWPTSLLSGRPPRTRPRDDRESGGARGGAVRGRPP